MSHSARFALAVLLTCALLAPPALGGIWFPRERASSVMSAVRACNLGPDRTGRVCDLDGLLTADQREELDRASSALGRSSACSPDAGLDAVVVLVHKMPRAAGAADADGEEEGLRGVDKSLRDFAESSLGYWRLGASCENGMVLVVSAEDKDSYIATGRMAKDTLSDDAAEDVGEEMEAYLRQGKLYHAISTGLNHVQTLLPDPDNPRHEHQSIFSSWGAHLVYGAAIVMFALLFVAYSNHVEGPERAIRQGEREGLVRNGTGTERAVGPAEAAGEH
jgi:uncharacterized membrane protein YgcG